MGITQANAESNNKAAEYNFYKDMPHSDKAYGIAVMQKPYTAATILQYGVSLREMLDNPGVILLMGSQHQYYFRCIDSQYMICYEDGTEKYDTLRKPYEYTWISIGDLHKVTSFLLYTMGIKSWDETFNNILGY